MSAAPPAPPGRRHPPYVPVEIGPLRLHHHASLAVTVPNGLFGDAAVYLKVPFERRVLLLDLGDIPDLSRKVAHQITDVFISHAHMDHFSGFPRLLRARIGATEPCRIYGPRDLSQRVAAMVDGFTWDRVGDKAQRFEVTEHHGSELRVFEIIAGRREPVPLSAEPVVDGVLRREEDFCVHATVLDHGIDVLAYAISEAVHLAVRPERLGAMGVEPGPWLSELKAAVRSGDLDAELPLPDDTSKRVADLAADLLLERPGQKLAYATDFGDTPENRRRLVELARGADLLICESSFLEEDAEQARRTGHLTTRACGEIAMEADVERLVPFHFSQRYQGFPELVYTEIAAVCDRVYVPKELRNVVSASLEA